MTKIFLQTKTKIQIQKKKKKKKKKKWGGHKNQFVENFLQLTYKSDMCPLSM
jgi:ribosomal protein L21